MASWYLYILECSDGTLYTGVTTDIERRVREHNSASGKGSKYTRARIPVALVYKEKFESKNEAFKRECEVKKLTRKEKKALFCI